MLGEPLFHIVVSLGRVIQVIWIIHHPSGALLIIPHEHGAEAGLRWLRLCFRRDDLQLLRGLLFRDHLLRVLLFLNDDHLRGSSRWHRSTWWHSSRGYGTSPPSLSSSSLSSSSSSISPMQLSPYSLAISMISSSWDWIIPSRLAFVSFIFLAASSFCSHRASSSLIFRLASSSWLPSYWISFTA
jgi:hypothetical protein